MASGVRLGLARDSVPALLQVAGRIAEVVREPGTVRQSGRRSRSHRSRARTGEGRAARCASCPRQTGAATKGRAARALLAAESADDADAGCDVDRADARLPPLHGL